MKSVKEYLNSWSAGQGKTSEIADSFTIVPEEENYKITVEESTVSIPKNQYLAYSLWCLSKDYRIKGVIDTNGINTLFNSWNEGFLTPNHKRCSGGVSPATKKVSVPLPEVTNPKRVLSAQDFKTSTIRIGVSTNTDMISGTLLEFLELPEKDRKDKANELLESLALYVWPDDKAETYNSILAVEAKDKEIYEFLTSIGFTDISRLDNGSFQASIEFALYQTAIMSGFSNRFKAEKLEMLQSTMQFKVEFSEITKPE